MGKGGQSVGLKGWEIIVLFYYNKKVIKMHFWCISISMPKLTVKLSIYQNLSNQWEVQFSYKKSL
jgi:hypothetical protein